MVVNTFKAIHITLMCTNVPLKYTHLDMSSPCTTVYKCTTNTAGQNYCIHLTFFLKLNLLS